MNDTQARRIDVALGVLVVFDTALTLVAGAFPGLWFRIFHGIPYDDPEGFLRRCAANWAAFAILQAVALWRWRLRPELLAVVAGARLGDALTDITYVAFARDVTAFARFSLIAVGPANLWLGWFFLRSFRRARQAPGG